jgi:hypothetical protein
MAATITVPLTTLTTGTHNYPATGGASVADTDTSALLTIDRTVKNGSVQGFNGQPATTQAQIQVYQSDDGGSTWVLLISGTVEGGAYTDAHGNTVTTSSVGVTFNPGTGRLARAAVVVSGASVAVSGSLAIQ